LFWKFGSPWPAQASKPNHWVSWAVVHGQWKLVANRDLSHVELFDITHDVTESNDLKSSKHDVVEELLGKLKSWQSSLPERPTGKVFSKLRQEPAE
jgi:hypothetical protein